MTTVAQQADVFLQSLQTRRRNPLKPATLKSYSSFLRNWIVPKLGTFELAQVDNGVVREFVNSLVAANLAPATMNGAITTLKMLVGSEVDRNGNKLNPREWKSDFINAPSVDISAQSTPIIASTALNSALRSEAAPQLYKVYYALAAGSGLRMGELMALRLGRPDGVRSFLDLEKGVIYTRSQIYGRDEQTPKTKASIREVDLCQPLLLWIREHLDGKREGEYIFTTGRGTVIHAADAYDRFNQDGIPGSHSLRRFRATHLENMSVPRTLLDFWIGHTGKSITDRYTKLGQSINARKNWCKRAGLGFQLPGQLIEEQVLYGEIGAEVSEEIYEV